MPTYVLSFIGYLCLALAALTLGIAGGAYVPVFVVCSAIFLVGASIVAAIRSGAGPTRAPTPPPAFFKSREGERTTLDLTAAEMLVELKTMNDRLTRLQLSVESLDNYTPPKDSPPKHLLSEDHPPKDLASETFSSFETKGEVPGEAG